MGADFDEAAVRDLISKKRESGAGNLCFLSLLFGVTSLSLNFRRLMTRASFKKKAPHHNSRSAARTSRIGRLRLGQRFENTRRKIATISSSATDASRVTKFSCSALEQFWISPGTE